MISLMIAAYVAFGILVSAFSFVNDRPVWKVSLMHGLVIVFCWPIVLFHILRNPKIIKISKK